MNLLNVMDRHHTCCSRALPVLFVAAVAAALYYFFCTLFAGHIALFLAFHCCFGLTLWSYFMALCTDPGGLAGNYQGQFLWLEQYVQVDLFTILHTYCHKCQRWRPPRAHHCAVCERCVLRMDHHCHWLGNCVGLKNHRFLIQFIAYGLVCCAAVGACCIIEQAGVVVTVFSVSLTLSLGGLLVFNLCLLWNNRTTLEMGRLGQFNVYDVGWKRNFEFYCGKKWVYYVLPLRGRQGGDGVTYPMLLRMKNGGVDFIDNRVYN